MTNCCGENTFCLNCCDNPTKNCKDKDVIPTDCKTCHNYLERGNDGNK